MKTILFLENGVYGGGSFESLFQIVENLDTTRFRPVIAFVNNAPIVDRFRKRNISVVMLQDALYTAGQWMGMTRFVTKALLRLQRWMPQHHIVFEAIIHRKTINAVCRIIQEHRIDLLHLNDQSVRDLYGVIAAQRCRIACVSHLRSIRVQSVHQRVRQYLKKHVNLFIANSQFTKNYWRALLDIPEQDIAVFYNTLDPVSTSPLDIRTALSIDSSVHSVIGCVGNLVDGKGQQFLIRSFNIVFRHNPSTVLLLVGDGPQRSQLEELSKQLGIDRAVIFTGYDTRAREIIAAVDVLVLPSETETFGRVLLEAMAVRTPIIATRVGGVPEVITNEENGLLVEYGDEQSLASAILRVIQDALLREYLRNGGTRVLQERFSGHNNTRLIEDWYDRFVGPGH